MTPQPTTIDPGTPAAGRAASVERAPVELLRDALDAIRFALTRPEYPEMKERLHPVRVKLEAYLEGE